MSIYVILLVCMGISGVVMAALDRLGHSQLMARHRTRRDRPNAISPKAHLISRAINSAVSTGTVFGLVYLLGARLFSADASASPLRVVLEAAAILAVYDLGYYLLHRFVFHAWEPGRRIHMVHHRVRTPYVNDSLYIHPVETVLGVGLLMASTLLVATVAGAMSAWSFGLAFLVYSVLNLFIHSAFDLPFFPFRALSSLSKNHDAHHRSMKGGFYASITPLWDHVFGTTKPG